MKKHPFTIDLSSAVGKNIELTPPEPKDDHVSRRNRRLAKQMAVKYPFPLRVESFIDVRPDRASDRPAGLGHIAYMPMKRYRVWCFLSQADRQSFADYHKIPVVIPDKFP